MKKIILAFSLFFSLLVSAQKDFVLGKIEVIPSKVLNEERTINIYFPAGYDATKAYPVIYLLDGSQNEDFIHIAGLLQYGNYEWVNIVSKSILVGIANVDRRRDFTYPTTIEKDKNDYPTTGESEKFISFLESELLPFVESKYKTTRSKTIIGQSLGGLLATEILYKKPTLFTNYIIISPSIWWDNESLFKLTPEFSKSNFNQKTKVFIGVGKEGKVMQSGAKKLFEIASKYKKDIECHFKYFDQANHGDILHMAVYKAFETLKI